MSIHGIKCFFGFHNYRIASYRHWFDVSYGLKCSYTTIYYGCLKCQKVKGKDIFGHIDHDDLTKFVNETNENQQ